MMSMLLLWLSVAQATTPEKGGSLGVGLGGGLGVSGVSLKLATDSAALQGMVGFSNGGLGVGLAFLLEQPTIATVGSAVDVAWNVGVGGSLGVGSPILLGASGVAGLEFNVRPVPLDVVLEYRPGLLISPFDLELVNFSGHVRYYF